MAATKMRGINQSATAQSTTTKEVNTTERRKWEEAKGSRKENQGGTLTEQVLCQTHPYAPKTGAKSIENQLHFRLMWQTRGTYVARKKTWRYVHKLQKSAQMEGGGGQHGQPSMIHVFRSPRLIKLLIIKCELPLPLMINASPNRYDNRPSPKKKGSISIPVSTCLHYRKHLAGKHLILNKLECNYRNRLVAPPLEFAGDMQHEAKPAKT
ncbi:hypothetical protein LXL04_027937 [Taraxacum kok-saghyz]